MIHLCKHLLSFYYNDIYTSNECNQNRLFARKLNKIYIPQYYIEDSLYTLNIKYFTTNLKFKTLQVITSTKDTLTNINYNVEIPNNLNLKEFNDIVTTIYYLRLGYSIKENKGESVIITTPTLIQRCIDVYTGCNCLDYLRFKKCNHISLYNVYVNNRTLYYQ